MKLIIGIILTSILFSCTKNNDISNQIDVKPIYSDKDSMIQGRDYDYMYIGVNGDTMYVDTTVVEN